MTIQFIRYGVVWGCGSQAPLNWNVQIDSHSCSAPHWSRTEPTNWKRNENYSERGTQGCNAIHRGSENVIDPL